MNTCTLQNKEYGHFIDLENNYKNIYPNNLKLMKQKYKIPINSKILMKSCKLNMNDNVHIMKTIPEIETFFEQKNKGNLQLYKPSCIIVSIISFINFYYMILKNKYV